MKVEDVIRGPEVVGRIGLYKLWAGGLIVPITYQANQIQLSWGHIAAMTIGRGNRAYRLQAMYIEYENVADPEDPVTIPAFGVDEGIDYYNDLAFSGTRDFLRVPLTTEPKLGIETGYEDYFTDGVDGNRLTFFAQSQGTQGIHGKAFSEGANSKACGVALVATPVFADRSQDVIFSRTYFDEENQTLKEASSQLGVTWEIAFLSNI